MIGLKEKSARLKKILLGCRSCLIAFSGGADSTFLLKAATLVLPRERILAVTAYSPAYPKDELIFSKKIARRLGVRHKIIRTRELENKRFIFNPADRCYFCKKELFARLKKMALKSKLDVVLDASNLSDQSDLRPGNTAKREYKIRSPLQEAGFTKEEIRKSSRELGLSTWDKPSLACLASRVPYGTRISPRILGRIDQAEAYIRNAGFKQVRLRHYDGLCRIEVEQKDISRLINKRKQVVDKLKKLGYNYVTIDLEGYRTGSMNEVIKR